VPRLKHLHSEGVIHRDVAARNVLVDAHLHVRVADFGFARLKEAGRSGGAGGYTASDVGPVKWSAPEAIRRRRYSEASDVFSFGVLLYEMVAQGAPWRGHSNMDVVVLVCQVCHIRGRLLVCQAYHIRGGCSSARHITLGGGCSSARLIYTTLGRVLVCLLGRSCVRRLRLMRAVCIVRCTSFCFAPPSVAASSTQGVRMGLPSEATTLGWHESSSSGGGDDDEWWGDDDAAEGWSAADAQGGAGWGVEPPLRAPRASSLPGPVPVPVPSGVDARGATCGGGHSRSRPWHVSARAMGPLEALMRRCWAEDAVARPSMGERPGVAQPPPRAEDVGNGVARGRE
jgi:hypothetical protein